MKGIHSMTTHYLPDPKQGEIWTVDFNPPRGSEISKIRPAVVVSADNIGRLPLRIVVPVTDWKDRYAQYPWFTEILLTDSNRLNKPSGADGFQVKSIACERFKKRIGKITGEALEDILLTIDFCLGK